MTLNPSVVSTYKELANAFDSRWLARSEEHTPDGSTDNVKVPFSGQFLIRPIDDYTLPVVRVLGDYSNRLYSNHSDSITTVFKRQIILARGH